MALHRNTESILSAVGIDGLDEGDRKALASDVSFRLERGDQEMAVLKWAGKMVDMAVAMAKTEASE